MILLDHMVLCDVIPEQKKRIQKYEELKKTLIVRPDPALEFQGRKLLREQEIKVKSEATVSEIFGHLCDCVEQLNDEANLWKKRARRAAQGGGPGGMTASVSVSESHSHGSGEKRLDLNMKSFYGLGLSDKVPQYLRLEESAEIGNLMFDQGEPILTVTVIQIQSQYFEKEIERKVLSN